MSAGDAGEAEILGLVKALLETADRWQASEQTLAHELRAAALRLTSEVLERTRRGPARED